MPTIPVLLALAGVAEATNIIVPTQQPNLTSAAAALVGPGPHTIQIVVDGVYEETDTLDFSGQDVTIVGTGSNNTAVRVLNAAASEVFNLNTGRLVLQDITITGDVSTSQAGLGLVDNLCFFANNRSGIVAENATVEIYDSELRCFFAQGAGGAVRATTSDLVIDGSHFEQNLALGSGGHIYLAGSTVTPPSIDVTNSEFTYGFSAGDGGAISIGNATPSLRDNRFAYNDSVVRGGAVSIISSVGAQAEVYGNTFDQNLSYANLNFTVFSLDDEFDTGGISGEIEFFLTTGEGGGVYIDHDNVDIWANQFCGNYSDVGGAISLEDPNAANIENNVFDDNWAFHYGGGMYVNAESQIQPPSVYNNTFNANSGGSGLPPQDELVVYGGGGHAFFDGTTADLRNNIFANAQHGGGVGGVDGANFTVGDPLSIEYNLWSENAEDFYGISHLVGDFDAHTLNQTNVMDVDPQPTWVGSGDLDCYPDAFYVEWGSPAVNRGDDSDASWLDTDGTQNDIGFTGGSRAPTFDNDGDGYMNTLDCNDHDPNVNPGAVEVCDLQDNDCDGEVDEGSDNTWYVDSDGDGYGEMNSVAQVTCTGPVGYVGNSDDCDDTNAAVNPSATEICDQLDNDCNGTTDDEELLTYEIYYVDADGDGWGVGAGVEDCALPSAPGPWTTSSGDCNDGDATINPQQSEFCDGIDNDCDGQIDIDAVDAQTYWPDNDGDGYGQAGTEPQSDCNMPATGASSNDGDCNDADVAISPEADELCDGLDNNCDGLVDDDPANAPDAEVYYEDTDGDGFFDKESELFLCPGAEVPTGFESYSGEFDCDPNDSTNTSEKCLGECGCQSTGGSPATGLLGLLAGLVLTLRRRA